MINNYRLFSFNIRYCFEVIKPENKLNNADTHTAIPTAAKIEDHFSIRDVLLTLDPPVFSIQLGTK